MALKYKTGGFKKRKFKALVQFICSECADDPSRLGYTKLNKILWYAETGHYIKTGEPLTGANYVKRQHGPVPACIEFMVDELVQEGKLHVRDVPTFGSSGFIKKEFITLSDAPIDEFFTASEITDVSRIIKEVCDTHTARSISRKSHTEPWTLAQIGEKMPLYTALANPGEVKEEDIRWADQQIARLEAAG